MKANYTEFKVKSNMSQIQVKNFRVALILLLVEVEVRLEVASQDAFQYCEDDRRSAYSPKCSYQLWLRCIIACPKSFAM